MSWFEIKIKTTSEAVEAVGGILYDYDAQGVAIEDPNELLKMDNDENSWDYMDEEELVFEYREGALVKAYFETEDLEGLLKAIEERVKGLSEFGLDPGLGEVTGAEVFEEDWANEWKKYFKPTPVGERIVIKPSWEEYEAKDHEVIIEIDPGGAFGSGTHETTSMCMEFLEQFIKGGERVFDIGCGSGILGITAAKLGAGSVIAGDIDQAAVETSIENAKMNHVTDIVEVKHGDLMEVVEGKADVIVANIIADIIIMLCGSISKFMKPDTPFITSGIILDKVEEVENAMLANGLEIIETRRRGEWAAIACRLKG